jgi:hypothetical protein
MDSYPRVRSDSVIGFMPRFAALEHLPASSVAVGPEAPSLTFAVEGLWEKQPRARLLAAQQELYPLSAGEVVKNL